MKKLTTKDFVERAIAVHGTSYDYGRANYLGGKVKVTITCPAHGDFEQTPANHLTGFGCIKCGFEKAGTYHKKDTNSFIDDAKKIHGDKYDYSETEYKGARENLTIVCPKHGAFQQQASNHLRVDVACLKCSYEERAMQTSMPLVEFISRSNEVHKNKYDYSLVSTCYKKLSDKVNIICPVHGQFMQSAAAHIIGKGCSECAVGNLSKKFMKSTVDFITDALKVHGSKYDYSKVEYSGAFDNVKIICPQDGVFLQTPTSHLAGIGCPKCSRRKQGAPRNLTRALRGEFDDFKQAYVYVISFKLPCSNEILYKVGSGTGSRIKTVVNAIKNVGGIYNVMLQFHFLSTGEAIVYEHLAHEKVMDHQFVIPPEFKFHGHSEVFTKLPVFEDIDLDPRFLAFKAGERAKSRRN
jgi:hypothetical protein